MSEAPAPAPERPANYLVGALFGFSAISIWASWMAITRLGVTTSLDPIDVNALRFGVAGVLLLPVLLRHGWGVRQIGWRRFCVIVLCGGAPYGLLAASGLRHAPAAHGGILIPGVMPLFVALISAVVMGERFPPLRKAGYVLIMAGVGMVAGTPAVLLDASSAFGHALLLTAALTWACYTVVLRQTNLGALHAAAIVSVSSAIMIVPVYLAFHGLRPISAPLPELAFQALYQGVVATVLSLYLFAKAVSILGASSSAAFGALVPALAALIAIPVLGEMPSPLDICGIVTVTVGVYLASGGPLPWRRTTGAPGKPAG